MRIKVEVEVKEIADAIIRKLTEDGTLAEVVRCRECKHGEKEDGQYYCHYTGETWNDGNFYCAGGERQ